MTAQKTPPLPGSGLSSAAVARSSSEKSGEAVKIEIETNTNTPELHVNRELRWNNLRYSVMVDGGKTKRTLLDSVDGLIRQGQVVAIMGGSGAGKSTLLNCLAGRIADAKGSELSGDILFNGKPRNPDIWRKTCAYVEQEDVMFANLTVEETISYAARLRLPMDMPDREKKERVNEIIMQLNLDVVRNTKIGDSVSRGVSGGEKKRVSVGVELVTDPELLFLDEPTSGLDAANSLNILKSIKALAVARNMVVLLTIHQPRTDILELFDNILLLSRGKTVWYGPSQGAISHFDQLGYPLPPKTNPSDFFLDIITLDARDKQLLEESSARIEKFDAAWRLYQQENPMSALEALGEVEKKRSWWGKPCGWHVEFGILLERDFKDLLRDKSAFFANIFQAIFIIILAGIIFLRMPTDQSGVQSRSGFLFFLIVNQSFGVVMPFLGVFPVVRNIIKRERASGTYRASAAYLSKIFSNLPPTLFSTLLTCCALYYFVGLQSNVNLFLSFVGIVLVHAYCSLCLGFMIGSSVPSVQLGQILGPLILTVFLLFGGLLFNPSRVTWAFQWIHYTSIMAYSYKALMQNEFTDELVFTCVPSAEECLSPNVTKGSQILNSYALASPSKWINVYINLSLSVVFLVIGFFAFVRTSRPLFRLK